MRRAVKVETFAPSAEAITAEEFAAWMKPLAPAQRLGIAVSGGPDSMALAFCAKRWADAHQAELMAFIVDHGLRPESAYEAEETRTRLKAIGISSEILCWEHPPIIARLHITARRARYRLLAEACARNRVGDLLLGHQREDQAETILMRLAKGSGVDGLAGMRAVTMKDGIRLLRPLLSVPRERLAATCHAARLPFIKDPANRSEKFARGRLRRILPLLAEEGLTVERLSDLGARAAEAKDTLDHYTRLFLQEATHRDAAGTIRIAFDKFHALPAAIAQRALITCLQDINAQDYAPEYASLVRLIEALGTEDMTPSTLHGCLISRTSSEITLVREYAAITDVPEIQADEEVIWDGRWKITLQEKGVFTLRPLGNPPHEALDRLAPGLRQRISQGRARASLPALWRGENLTLVPSLISENSPAYARLVRAWPPQ
ncbi:MAG: tRNA lysidine(34) synthetase TilS [Alphaproteobacteria bacterium]|nr:tRNA lysidine(34) synthetase TilS [Alphaproteobacteria bacterium]